MHVITYASPNVSKTFQVKGTHQAITHPGSQNEWDFPQQCYQINEACTLLC